MYNDDYQYYKDEILPSKPGLHFSGFSTSLIKFEGELRDTERLENESLRTIIYYKYCNCFKLMTNDPQDYLKEEELKQKWTKI